MPKRKKQTSGLYRTSVNIGYHDDGRIKKRYFSARTIKELDEKVAEFRQKLSNGLNLLDEDITFEAYAARWLSTYKANRSVRTFEMYDNILKRYCSGLNDQKLKDIRRADIQDAVNSVAEHPRTAEQLLLTLKQVMTAAVQDDIIRKSVCVNIELPRHDKKEKRAFTSEEKKAIKSADLNVRQRAFVSLLYGTGLRPAEAYALTWSDVDFNRCEIHVNKALSFEGGLHPIVSQPKTASGMRVVQAPIWVFKALSDYKGTNSHIALFAGDNGQYRTKQAYARSWRYIKKKIEDKLGYPTEITPYYFRHNYCTELYYSGISLLEAQRLMGHSSYEMIMRIYSHLDATRENTHEKLNKIAF